MPSPTGTVTASQRYPEPIERLRETRQVCASRITASVTTTVLRPARIGGEHVVGRLQQPLADHDVVPALREIDADGTAFRNVGADG